MDIFNPLLDFDFHPNENSIFAHQKKRTHATEQELDSLE